MEVEWIALLISAIFGSGGIVAWLKAKSEVRNANKETEIKSLQCTIKSLQESQRELQDRYQEIIDDLKKRYDELSKEMEFLRIEYVKQSQNDVESRKRITELEIELKRAKNEIEQLKEQLRKRDITIMELQEENIDLRKLTRKGLAE